MWLPFTQPFTIVDIYNFIDKLCEQHDFYRCVLRSSSVLVVLASAVLAHNPPLGSSWSRLSTTCPVRRSSGFGSRCSTTNSTTPEERRRASDKESGLANHSLSSSTSLPSCSPHDNWDPIVLSYRAARSFPRRKKMKSHESTKPRQSLLPAYWQPHPPVLRLQEVRLNLCSSSRLSTEMGLTLSSLLQPTRLQRWSSFLLRHLRPSRRCRARSPFRLRRARPKRRPLRYDKCRHLFKPLR